jgi:hypothetical protein
MPYDFNFSKGSVLDPLLFLLFINDIADDIQSLVRLFADDSSLIFSSTNPSILIIFRLCHMILIFLLNLYAKDGRMFWKYHKRPQP